MKNHIHLSLIFSYLLLCAQDVDATDISCPAAFEKITSDVEFDSYKVNDGMGSSSKPTTPDVRLGRAHLYRTVIREGAKAGPNFAGKFTIVQIGCGAATVCLAIVDATSGKVYFPPELVSAEALLVDTGESNVSILNYRKESNLLIVIGSPNEQSKRAGISYYVWEKRKLKLIRYVPAEKFCGAPDKTRF